MEFYVLRDEHRGLRVECVEEEGCPLQARNFLEHRLQLRVEVEDVVSGRRALPTGHPAWPKAWLAGVTMQCAEAEMGGVEGLNLSGTESLSVVETVTPGSISGYQVTWARHQLL